MLLEIIVTPTETTQADDKAPPTENPPDFPIRFAELAPAIEFCCWVVVALAPFLRWVNGAAVTDDQFVIQVTLVSLAAAGAIGLRLYNWLSGRHNPGDSVPPRIADDAPDRT